MEPGLLALLVVKTAVVGLSVAPLLRSDAARFAGKAMGVRAILYPASTLLIPAIWLFAGRPTPYPFLADVAFGLPFGAILIITILWPPPGTPSTLFGWA